jgi:intracellular multiplication protein IcmT
MDKNTHWRDSARTPRLLFLDYRAVLPYVYLMLSRGDHLIYNLVIVTLATLFFGVIEYFGFSYSVFLRWLRGSLISGRYKKARPWWVH